MRVISLDDIGGTYARVARSIERAMEDAADFNDGARFSVLERDQIIVDAAFFVLIWPDRTTDHRIGGSQGKSRGRKKRAARREIRTAA